MNLKNRHLIRPHRPFSQMLKRAVCHTGNQLFILDAARFQAHAAGADFGFTPEDALRKEPDVAVALRHFLARLAAQCCITQQEHFYFIAFMFQQPPRQAKTVVAALGSIGGSFKTNNVFMMLPPELGLDSTRQLLCGFFAGNAVGFKPALGLPFSKSTLQNAHVFHTCHTQGYRRL